MTKLRKDSGFTLIELMIVIAVIGILAVVLVPKMAGVKTTAKEVGVLTNVKSVQAYVTANISKWANSSSVTQSDIGEKVYDNFSNEDNQLKNPFYLTSVIHTDNKIGDFDTTSNTTVGPDNEDALQILSSTPTTGTTPKGGVVVIIPSDFNTIGITIQGYDDSGNEIGEDIVIKN